jgi:hypothetical protein
MFAQLFESFRRASEATMQAQQDLFRQWVQQWPSMPVSSPGTASEWSEAVQKRWLDSAKDTLNKQRELLDTTYRSGIDVIEQSYRVGEAKSPEEYRRVVEDLWRKLSDTFKQQSESQFREFQGAAEKWFELARNAPTAPESDSSRNYRDANRAYSESQTARA